ncbi:hypothetical protein NE619_02580 [Anaerovorax odorimutans]|uniref:Uncharacterized protein n=1 Tax=Anaerovorax odorimutans TaxID=109327 RepID=A0ABT1RK87_9FIRM|nr:hypothetical protein [Anaerovorax odorimutans]MCQ4635602.1 hypothetical protein [Anaerovorax odorimutans]
MTTIALPILAVAAVVILLILVIALILWRKQSAIELSTLENIEKRLAAVEKALTIRIRQEAAAAAQRTPAADQPKNVQETQMPRKESREPEPPPREDSGIKTSEGEKEPGEEKNEQENTPAESSQQPEMIQTADVSETAPAEEIEPDGLREETLDKGSETPATSIYNIGKSGKIYTKEDLELLIKE